MYIDIDGRMCQKQFDKFKVTSVGGVVERGDIACGLKTVDIEVRMVVEKRGNFFMVAIESGC